MQNHGIVGQERQWFQLVVVLLGLVVEQFVVDVQLVEQLGSGRGRVELVIHRTAARPVHHRTIGLSVRPWGNH